MGAWSEPAGRAAARRKELGLSIAAVAERLDVEAGLYESFEAGDGVLGTEDLRRLADLLGMTVDELLLGDDPKHVLLRADDGADAEEAVEISDTLIRDYLFLEALVGR